VVRMNVMPNDIMVHDYLIMRLENVIIMEVHIICTISNFKGVPVAQFHCTNL
jgi:hypothetical protein